MRYDVFVEQFENYLENDEVEKAQALFDENTRLAAPDEHDAPYSVKLVFTGAEISNDKLDTSESSVVIPIANWMSRRLRNARYRLKVRSNNFKGLRIVSEGDSWFQFPKILHDIIDHISDEADFAVYSLGAGGDTIANMAAESEHVKAISKYQPHAFLLSGGGNDVVESGNLEAVLKQWFNGALPEQLIDREILAAKIDQVMKYYKIIISGALSAKPDLIIYGHGYDTPKPKKGGSYIGKPLAGKNIPLDVGEKVIALILKSFNEALSHLATQYNGQFVHLNLTGKVGNTASSWYDELHPKNTGFERAAKPFITALREQLATTGNTHSERFGLPNMFDEQADNLNLEEATGVTLTASMRHLSARMRNNDAYNVSHTGSKRSSQKAAEVAAAWKDIALLYAERHLPEPLCRSSTRESYSLLNSDNLDERVIDKNDIDDFNILSRGTKVGRSVGKVMISMADGRKGSGSGFLVGPNLFLTNNHVLSAAHTAENSEVFFHYENDDHGSPITPVRFQITDEIFYTNKALDFTFVSLSPVSKDGVPLSKYGILPLLPATGKALKTERVSIIQHPNGDHKKVALRDNFVLGVARSYMYYVTDTKRGSSGSPVFNLEWQVAALHHQTVPHKNSGKFLANRGVRISSILRHVSEEAATGVSQAQFVDALVKAGRGSGPWTMNSSTSYQNDQSDNDDHASLGTDTRGADIVLSDGPFAGLSIADAAAALGNRTRGSNKKMEALGLNDEWNEISVGLSSDAARGAISDRAYRLIVDYETGGRSYYKQILKEAATWPGGKSGVTIGFGYDLAHHSAKEVKRDWSPYLSKGDLKRYINVIGLKGKDAKNVTPGLRDIKISFEDASRVFEARTLPKYVGYTFNSLPKASLQKLHPHCVGALVSLVFNRGPAFRNTKSRFREMRAILAHMKSERFRKIPAEFRSMKRIWAGKGLDGLLRRRDDEARLFQDGLDSHEIAYTSSILHPDSSRGGAELDSSLMSGEDEEGYAEAVHEEPSTEDTLLAPEADSSLLNEAGAPKLTVGHARWASPKNHPDYHHLPLQFADGSFNLDSAVIEGLIQVGAYSPVIGDHNKLLISLRGCQMLDAENYLENQSSIRLMPATPDHERFRCVIGVYDTVSNQISLFKASTVPRRTGMLRFYDRMNFGKSAMNCNLLPTGCYEHCVGTHNSKSKGKIKYVLRLGHGPDPSGASMITVLRTKNDLIYGTRDYWDTLKVSDNIHPAFLSSSFSSVGCLTVYGSQKGNNAPVTTATGGWAKFQKAGGFSGNNYEARYDNILTSGHEAAAVASYLSNGGNLSDIVCLRHGSKGKDVERLQNMLGITADGNFGAQTKRKLAQLQIDRLGYATGTWSKSIADELGMSW